VNRPLLPDPTTSVCEACGATFRCGLLGGDAACWCSELPSIPPERLRKPDGSRRMTCLCPACLGALANTPVPPAP